VFSALTQNQTRGARPGTDVLHRPGRSREKDQLLHKGREWPVLDINESLRSLLQRCRETLVRLQKTESALVRSLERKGLLTVYGHPFPRPVGRALALSTQTHDGSRITG
jgi:hypothetical protein